MIIPPLIRRLVCAALMAFALGSTAHAQWVTQTLTLRPGWNAVYLHVNASHDTLENLVGALSPISEIWLWKETTSEGRIVNNLSQPISGSDWAPWTRASGPVNAFSLRANAAYLVRNAGPTDYTWSIKGKPVPPSVRWTASGLNFIGFPTRPDSPPNFANFLSFAPAWNNFVLFQYPGGEAANASPATAPLVSLNTTPVTRGQAVWIKKQDNSDNRYFGPFEWSLQDFRGVVFSETLGSYAFRLRNTLPRSNSVSITLIASEISPTGVVSPTPPLLLRTTLDTTTLRYAYTNLPINQARTFQLTPKGQPGSEYEIVLGLDRANMVGAPGTPFAGILRLQDTTLGHLQVDLPVTATQASTEGLWVGEASITQVGNYLKTYAKATNAVHFTNQLAQLAELNEGYKSVRFTNESWTPHTLTFTDLTPIAMDKAWVSIASSADGTRRVAATEDGQLFTSPDGGRSWTPRGSLSGWTTLASSADGTKLVAAVSGGPIFTSEDAGVSWTPRDSARAWVSVASSTDGTRLLAAAFAGQLYTSTNSGSTWTPQETSRDWAAVASSSDGTNLVAAVSGGQIHTSTDGGVTWVPRDSARTWVSVASSANGSSLVASVTGGSLYTSSNGGVTWTARDSVRTWGSVASSTDGIRLVAVESGGRLYTSSNAGLQWTPQETARDWTGIATSADGSTLAAVVYGGRIYESLDAGITWAIGYPSVSSVASSTDGMALVAVAKGSRIYTSTNAGTHWTAQTGAPATNWQAVASSADGVRLVAAVQDGPIYTSTDSGTNWAPRAGAPSARWQAVASSADGLKLVAVVDGGNIYTSADGGSVWTQRIPLANQRWRSVASSADGQRLVAAIQGGSLYASSNSGVTWSPLLGAPGTAWQSVACSADGKMVVAVQNPGGIYASIDFGTTWDLKASAPPASPWQSIASSTNGNALVAAVAGGRIYTSPDAGKTWTAREGSRSWSAVASSADGTRLVAGTAGSSAQLYTTTGSLITPELVYDPQSNLILSGGGKYLTASFNTELGDVPAPFPLRLIVHHAADGSSKLLQRVFVGPSALDTNTILTLQESKLHPNLLSQARRLSAVHLPLSNTGWVLQGDFGGVGILNAVLTDGFDNTTSNPFLHAYHPDHDNLDALFDSTARKGAESYDIKRQITLSFTPPDDDFVSRTVGSSKVRGTYLENIVLKGGENQTRTVVTKGTFVLNRVSSIATLQ
jgi:hypothetical protein